jgi:formylglycine-generating enzyme required for sulfatase activity
VADFHYGQDKGNKLLTDYAWYRNNSSGETKPVGQKNPNAWGLYDMTGNVYEWVWDWHGNYVAVEQTDPCGPGTGFGRVCRGGSWKSEPWKLSSWFRQYFVPGIKNNEIGFRICKQA